MAPDVVRIPSASSSFDASILEDDGAVELALMATAHPEVSRCGALMLNYMASGNELLQRCAPWIHGGKYPDTVTEASRSVHLILSSIHKEIESLDDIDLNELKPDWGDKDAIRMARKSLISFAQDIIRRLDGLQLRLAEAVARFANPEMMIPAIAAQQKPKITEASRHDTKAAASHRSRSRGRASGPATSRKNGGKACDDGSETTDTGERALGRRTPHFAWEPGTTLGDEGRYAIQKQVGEGSFGRVLSCTNVKNNKVVAVKVVKGVKRYREHAEAEAEVLRHILRCDPGSQSRCVKLFDEFLHFKQNVCLVFELLDMSLTDLLKQNGGQGFLVRDICTIARQMFQSLSFLSGMGLVHTDIKCRNVMLRDARGDMVPLPRKPGVETRSIRKCDVVVIDFGGAVIRNERHSKRIGTRQYRAPEVVLGLPWDEKCDIWSVGCILMTLYVGERLFPVRNQLEHLALMERVLGCELPRSMLKSAVATGSLPSNVTVDGRGRMQCSLDAHTSEFVQSARPFEEHIHSHHAPLLRLLQGLLRPDPKSRHSADSALTEPVLAHEGGLPE